jgi:hypothetical protein
MRPPQRACGDGPSILPHTRAATVSGSGSLWAARCLAAADRRPGLPAQGPRATTLRVML